MFDALVNTLLDIGAVVGVALVCFAVVLYLADKHASRCPRVEHRQPAGACWRVLPPLDRGAAPFDWQEDE